MSARIPVEVYETQTYAYGRTSKSPMATTVGLALNNSEAALLTACEDTFSREENEEVGEGISPEKSYH